MRLEQTIKLGKPLKVKEIEESIERGMRVCMNFPLMESKPNDDL